MTMSDINLSTPALPDLAYRLDESPADPAGTPIVYSDRRVIDEHGQQIGRVSDVVFEGSSAKPAWMVLKLGPLRGCRYVPAHGSYATVTDKLVVPFDRRTIAASPKAKGSHVLSAKERSLLIQHYHLVPPTSGA